LTQITSYRTPPQQHAYDIRISMCRVRFPNTERTIELFFIDTDPLWLNTVRKLLRPLYRLGFVWFRNVDDSLRFQQFYGTFPADWRRPPSSDIERRTVAGGEKKTNENVFWTHNERPKKREQPTRARVSDTTLLLTLSSGGVPSSVNRINRFRPYRLVAARELFPSPMPAAVTAEKNTTECRRNSRGASKNKTANASPVNRVTGRPGYAVHTEIVSFGRPRREENVAWRETEIFRFRATSASRPRDFVPSSPGTTRANGRLKTTWRNGRFRGRRIRTVRRQTGRSGRSVRLSFDNNRRTRRRALFCGPNGLSRCTSERVTSLPDRTKRKQHCSRSLLAVHTHTHTHTRSFVIVHHRHSIQPVLRTRRKLYARQDCNPFSVRGSPVRGGLVRDTRGNIIKTPVAAPTDNAHYRYFCVFRERFSVTSFESYQFSFCLWIVFSFRSTANRTRAFCEHTHTHTHTVVFHRCLRAARLYIYDVRLEIHTRFKTQYKFKLRCRYSVKIIPLILHYVPWRRWVR